MAISGSCKCLTLLIIATLLSLGGQSLHAEEATPLDTLKLANAAIHRFTLDNGMICLVKEDHSAPVVAVQIWVGIGAIHEHQYLGSGLSHAVEHMIFKGTPSRPIGAITREINAAGGTINAYTSFERTVFHTVMPSPKWEVGLDVLSDAVMNASFPEEEWVSEKEVIVREMAMGRDDPNRVLSKLLWRTAYSTHPFKHPIIGYEDVFRERTREDLADYFSQNYTSDNMIMVVVGDVNPADAQEKITETFSDFKRHAHPPITLPEEPEQISPRFARETGAYQVSRLHWSYPAVALQHPDTATLDVLSSIVGHGKSSRLTQELKDNLELVFEIDAWSWTPKEPGLFTISATYAPNKEDTVLAAIQDQIDHWATTPFPEAEVQKAKRMTLVHELSQLQTMDGQANSIGSGEFYAGDPRFSERYLELVEEVTPEKIMAAVQKYLVPHKRTLVILAPQESNKAKADASTQLSEQSVPERVVLDNGIPLVALEDHRLPFVHMCFVLNGGLLSETEENSGITRMMAELLTRGTAQHNAEEMAAQVEQLGASLSPFSGNNSFGLQARCLTEDIETIMSLATECLLTPTFPEAELEKQRAVQLAAIQQQHEKPFFLAQKALKASIFPGHPYAGSAQGTTESVSKLTREQIAEHFQKHLATGNLVISIMGDITPEQAVEIANRHLAALPEGPKPVRNAAPLEPQLPTKTVQREPKEQAIMLVGYPGVDVNDSRADSVAFLQTAFSGLSSELGNEVREKRGLVYYVGALQRTDIEPGYFAFYAGTREDAVEELEGLINAEVERVATTGLTEEEFARVREQLLGQHQMQMQNMGYLAQVAALNELYGLGHDYLFTFEDRIKALTHDDLKETVQSLLKADQQAVSLLLPQTMEKEEER